MLTQTTVNRTRDHWDILTALLSDAALCQTKPLLTALLPDAALCRTDADVPLTALSGDALLTALSGDALLTALCGPACTGRMRHRMTPYIARLHDVVARLRGAAASSLVGRALPGRGR